MAKYQGEPVELLRDAQASDQGFEEGQDQVLIRLQNHQQRVVKREEVEGIEGGGQKPTETETDPNRR